ncbi:MAG: 5'/3'-nucleotidase SurE [Candidatus Dormibacteraeota bacterium]|nr:5'/3'-nucleotidase SurE [Candidatus Dormibacteraeota bacterium]
MDADRRPLALITNDDGIESPGLLELALAALDAGLRVLVAAPLEESSGSSAAVGGSQQEGRIVVSRHDLPGLGTEAFALPAAPALITLLACAGRFGEAPELVLSGINRGANWGSLVAHSGTVGAALTGAGRGRRSLAVSLCSREAVHWETARAVAAAVIPSLRRLPPATVLSVNVPDVPPAELRGLAAGHVARAGEVQTTMGERMDGYVRTGALLDAGAAEPGTDMALVAAGYAAVTALRPVGEDAALFERLTATFPPAPDAAAAGAQSLPAPPQGAPPGR